jgi:hypothetical protein
MASSLVPRKNSYGKTGKEVLIKLKLLLTTLFPPRLQTVKGRVGMGMGRKGLLNLKEKGRKSFRDN